MTLICQIADIDPENGKEAFVEDLNGGRWVALFRHGATVLAYLNSCPHQGRALNYAADRFLFDEEGRLVCPHHGACFGFPGGECVSGPCAGASLTPVSIRVEVGSVLLSGKNAQ